MTPPQSTGFAAPTDESVAGLVARHAVDLEQCALFVDSEPLKRSMTDAAAFLRGPVATALSTAERALLTVQNAAKTIAAAHGTELEHLRQNASFDHSLRAEVESLRQHNSEMTDALLDSEARATALEAQLARVRKALGAALIAPANYAEATVFARGRSSIAAEALNDNHSPAPDAS